MSAPDLVIMLCENEIMMKLENLEIFRRSYQNRYISSNDILTYI